MTINAFSANAENNDLVAEHDTDESDVVPFTIYGAESETFRASYDDCRRLRDWLTSLLASGVVTKTAPGTAAA